MKHGLKCTFQYLFEILMRIIKKIYYKGVCVCVYLYLQLADFITFSLQLFIGLLPLHVSCIFTVLQLTDRQTDSIDFNSVYLPEVSWTHNLRLC